MTFMQQIGIALGLSAVGASVHAIGGSVPLVIAVVSLGYGGALMAASEERVGRIVVGAAVVAATLASGLWLDVSWFAVCQTGLIWMVRSLYVHRRMSTSVADIGLSVLALGAGVWAAQTGSTFLALWAFFLVQALHVWLPGNARATSRHDSRSEFNDAERIASAAMQRLLRNDS
jgi:hypothetical protein